MLWPDKSYEVQRLHGCLLFLQLLPYANPDLPVPTSRYSLLSVPESRRLEQDYARLPSGTQIFASELQVEHDEIFATRLDARRFMPSGRQDFFVRTGYSVRQNDCSVAGCAWLDPRCSTGFLSEYMLCGKMHSAQRVTYFRHGCMLRIQRYVSSGYALRAWMLGCF